MIFLFNQERVLTEILELARLRIAGELKIPVERVVTEVQLDKGLIKPAFHVDMDKDKAIDANAVGSVIETTWNALKGELTARLASIWMVRNDGGKEKAKT